MSDNDEVNFNIFVQEHGSNIFGTDEYGLTFSDALSAIRLAREENLPILGGDVYNLKSGEIEPAYANWYVNRLQNEDETEYGQRTWVEAEEYIKNYPKPANGSEVLFVFVVDNNKHS